MISMANQAVIHLPSLENMPVMTSLFENCKSIEQLRQIHALTIKTGVTSLPNVQNKLVALTCDLKDDKMAYARQVFDEIREPSVFAWNTMIKGFSGINSPEDGVSMFVQMLGRSVEPDRYTFPFLLKGFKRRIASLLGKELHAQAVKHGFGSNVFVQNALVNMYSASWLVEMARRVFDSSSERDAVTWNAMISGYNRVKNFEESKNLFEEMERNRVSPTSVTYVLVLSACSKSKDLGFGERVRKSILERKVSPNLVLENALIDMYAANGETGAALEIFEGMKNRDVISWTTIVMGFVNSGRVDLARKYFDRMPRRDSISWTAMIDGYIGESRFKEALELFREMQTSNTKPDEFTVVSVLTACANLGALELGEWVRTYVEKNEIKKDTFVGNALVDMYFKCGSVEKALRVFDEMPRRDKFTWTAAIVGLAINGHGERALEMFSRMTIEPDEITCLGVLCACSHSGMVEKGRRFFASMITRHGIHPNIAHYGCLVDLLGRAGNLREAHEVIRNMPMKPNSIIWGSLLGACRVHKDSKLAEIAAEKILESEPENDSAVYSLLCNVYASCNEWENLRGLRRTIADKGIKKKIPGCSLIEMNGEVHEFVAGDNSHPKSEEIFARLREITRDMRLAGYSPDTSSEVFRDLGEKSSVYRHSEKLAIAFGLIGSEPGATIRVVKNLRMCVDCHSMAKSVSEVYGREVVLRDRTRFHRFKNGLCSCKDYW